MFMEFSPLAQCHCLQVVCLSIIIAQIGTWQAEGAGCCMAYTLGSSFPNPCVCVSLSLSLPGVMVGKGWLEGLGSNGSLLGTKGLARWGGSLPLGLGEGQNVGTPLPPVVCVGCGVPREEGWGKVV